MVLQVVVLTYEYDQCHLRGLVPRPLITESLGAQTTGLLPDWQHCPDWLLEEVMGLVLLPLCMEKIAAKTIATITTATTEIAQ